VLKVVGEAVGFCVEGSVSHHSVSCIALEGLVTSQAQIADVIEKAKVLIIYEGTTYSRDKTAHRHLTFEASHITTKNADGSVTQFHCGVHSAHNHTSETQFNGFTKQNKNCFQVYNEIMGPGKCHLDFQIFAILLQGALTDHAANQK
ncbi:hypothetical protein M422DRAFT_139012, partial [Sphaerobolus stellatus SS14]